MRTILPAPEVWKQQYEALRKEAIEGNPLGPRGHGLALFLTQGMTSWLRALSALTSRLAPVVAPTPASLPLGSAPALPSAVRSDLTLVLANMVLACSSGEGR